MKIYGCDATHRKICRLCDKTINTSHIVLEFNSILKLFFHKKCWEEFTTTITSRKGLNCVGCGKEISITSVRCISCSNKNRPMFGEKNPHWGGENVTLGGLHQWLKVHNPKPKLCERCKKYPPFDLANKTGNYTRNIKDYYWLCRKCHMETDGRLKNLKNQDVAFCPRCEGFYPETHSCFGGKTK